MSMLLVVQFIPFNVCRIQKQQKQDESIRFVTKCLIYCYGWATFLCADRVLHMQLSNRHYPVSSMATSWTVGAAGLSTEAD